MREFSFFVVKRQFVEGDRFLPAKIGLNKICLSRRYRIYVFKQLINEGENV